MKIDETSFPSVRRTRNVKELEREIFGLVKRYSYAKIGEFYGISETNVWYILRRALLDKYLDDKDKIEVQDEFSKQDYMKSEGAWMNSAERKSLINYKKK